MVALWIEILLQANYCQRSWHGEVYEKGSFPTSLEKLSAGTGLSIRQTRTCLERLKSTNEVTIEATNRGTKIIVNKWAEYQCSDDDSDKQIDTQNDIQATSKRQASDKQATTLKEIKEIKKTIDEDKYKEAFGNDLAEQALNLLKPYDYTEQQLYTLLMKLYNKEIDKPEAYVFTMMKG